ncbi:MAG: hypothetical protein RLW42_21575, partial [Gammaproteobacteria bacterium]
MTVRSTDLAVQASLLERLQALGSAAAPLVVDAAPVADAVSAVLETTLRAQPRARYIRVSPGTAAPAGGTAVDLLRLKGGADYETTAQLLQRWLPCLAGDAIMMVDGYQAGSAAARAIGEHVPFAHFLPAPIEGELLVLRRTTQPRQLVLCGGMQSSGSSLVSMCFLQRGDLDGVYDLDNPLVQQDFTRVTTSHAWVKMTIGAFRLGELAALYRAQGWQVSVLLVTRELREILVSLAGKWYGHDGCTGDDPPLYTRLLRYREDLREAAAHDWVCIEHAALLADPAAVLGRTCAALGLPWDDGMLDWPRDPDTFAYPSLGNESLRASLGAGGVAAAISRYRQRATDSGDEDPIRATQV